MKILNNSWQKILKKEFKKPYFLEIENFLKKEKENWKIIFPLNSLIFNVFNLINFEDLKIVIIWQDPYHWDNQAHWLCFSVQNWIKIPPSLKNIFKELNTDLWIKISNSWNLEKWAKQWVFLLNSILTVEKWKPASHSKIGWENFTNSVIKKISDEKDWVIFLLWGNFAKSKKVLIDEKKHFILESAHPSPFSVKKFYWWKHFSKTNKILKENWKKEINWEI